MNWKHACIENRAKLCRAKRETLHILFWDLDRTGSNLCFTCPAMTNYRCEYSGRRNVFAPRHAMDIHQTRRRKRPCILPEPVDHRSVGALRHGQTPSTSKGLTIRRFFGRSSERLVTDRAPKCCQRFCLWPTQRCISRHMPYLNIENSFVENSVFSQCGLSKCQPRKWPRKSIHLCLRETHPGLRSRFVQESWLSVH